MNNILIDRQATVYTLKHNTGTGPTCRHCHNSICDEVPNEAVVRLFFSWLPIKRYLCPRCLRHFYVVDK